MEVYYVLSFKCEYPALLQIADLCRVTLIVYSVELTDFDS